MLEKQEFKENLDALNKKVNELQENNSVTLQQYAAKLKEYINGYSHELTFKIDELINNTHSPIDSVTFIENKNTLLKFINESHNLKY